MGDNKKLPYTKWDKYHNDCNILSSKALYKAVDFCIMRIKWLRLRRVTLRLSLCMLLAALLSAQTDTAGLFGVVRGASGGVVAASKVALQNRASGAAREQVTDAKGL